LDCLVYNRLLFPPQAGGVDVSDQREGRQHRPAGDDVDQEAAKYGGDRQTEPREGQTEHTAEGTGRPALIHGSLAS